jgi:hypothetical protein
MPLGTSPDPVAVERQAYLTALGLTDDPEYTLNDLKNATAGGANVNRAVKIGKEFNLFKAIFVNVLDHGVVGDGVTDDTAAIKAIVAKYPWLPIYFPPNLTYLITAHGNNTDHGGGITLGTQGTLIWAYGATFIMQTANVPHYQMFDITAPDVKIFGGKLIGDVLTHTGAVGEWGHGIMIGGGASRCLIRDTQVYNCYGDGIYVCEAVVDVEIINAYCDSNRRQGMSIVNSVRTQVIGGKFVNTGRIAFTGPGAGIDLEPNSGVGGVIDCVIDGVIFNNNKGPGFVSSANTQVVSATVSNCRSANNDSFGFSTASGSTTDTVYVGCVATSNLDSGFSVTAGTIGTKFFSCVSKSNLLRGFIDSGTLTTFRGCEAVNNGQQGYYLAGTTTRLHACTANACGYTAGGPEFDIYGTDIIIWNGNAICGTNATKPTYGYVIRTGSASVNLQFCEATGAFSSGKYTDQTKIAILNPPPGSAIKSATSVYNIKDYGAAGDGTIDDTAAINTAIGLANTAGGTVFVPGGTYIITAALTSLANGVTVQGEGPYRSVIRSTSATADFFVSNGASLIAIKDLQLESLITRTAGSAFNFTSVTGYIIDNIRIIDTYNLGTFMSSNSGWITRIKVAHGTGTINNGFFWQSCVDTHLAHCLFNGGTVTLPGTSAWLTVDSGCDTWAGVDIGAAASSGSGTCLYLSHSLSPGSFAPRWIKLTNFWFEASHGGVAGGNGIQIDNCLTAYFVNGYVATSSTGINIIGGRDIKFQNIVCMNNWLRGVVLSGATGPFDINFKDCSFDSNSQGANNNVGHFLVGGSTVNVRIIDCYFGQSILSRANKPSYALELSVAFNNDVQVKGCKFTAADYATGIVGGTQAFVGGMFRDNKNLNPRGNVSPAVPATTVAQTNNTGVDATVYIAGGTVSAIAVMGVTTGLTAGTFRVPVGQTITLTYTVAPTWVWIGE